MHKDYVNAIVCYYEYRKKQADFPQRLIDPSPGTLRDECLDVFRDRWERRDTPTFKDFFGAPPEPGVTRPIQNVDLDKLRPVRNFFMGSTQNPGRKNLEMVAWLLDFPLRPFDDKSDYEKFQKELIDSASRPEPAEQTDPDKGIKEDRGKALENGPANGRGISDEGVIQQGQRKQVSEGNDKPGKDDEYQQEIYVRPDTIRSWHRPAAMVVVLLGLAFWVYQRGSIAKPETPGGIMGNQCMIWLGDHYEAISCDSLAKDQPVVKLDPVVLKNLRRVTRMDTITSKDVRKLWYRKRAADSLDVYTWYGADPSEPGRYLRPLTAYMYTKYFGDKFGQAVLTTR